jgi:twitching motility protein PilT
MNLDELLARVIDLGGSDLHLKVNSPAMVRVDGDLVPAEQRLLTDSDLETVLLLITERSPAKREHFLETGDLDNSYIAEGIGRFRVNAFRQRGSISFAFRFVPKEIPSFERLGLPVGVGKLAQEHRGLVLVTGATGSGKSTTLAAMINWLNRNRKQHIVTIEDPIEFVHDDWASIVNQREVGSTPRASGRPCGGCCARTPTSSSSASSATRRRRRRRCRRPSRGTSSSRLCTPSTPRRPSGASSSSTRPRSR